MKKYLMIAASLVAGSAFVNAEELNFGNTVGYLSFEHGTLTPSSSTISLSDNALTILEESSEWAKIVRTDRNRSVGTLALTFDSQKLFSLIGDTDRLLLAFDGASGDLGLGLSSAGKLTGTWNTNYKYFESGIAVTNEPGTLSVVFTLGSSGTQIWKDADRNFYTNTSLKGELGTVKAIKFGDGVLDALNNLIGWDVDGYGNKVTVASAFRSTESLISSIPEPSAFGLLAGLGALCLVGTRRRRS